MDSYWLMKFLEGDKHMNKPLLRLIACLLLTLYCLQAIALASEIVPYADQKFDFATTVLLSTKEVSFRAATYSTMDCLSVTACWLEIEETNGSWSYVCSLPAPTVTYTNAYAYFYTQDYSAYIGTGKYRVWATYDADGHSITRCSNERIF